MTTNIPINSAIALNTQVWLVLFACKNAGLVCKKHTYSVNQSIHDLSAVMQPV